MAVTSKEYNLFAWRPNNITIFSVENENDSKEIIFHLYNEDLNHPLLNSSSHSYVPYFYVDKGNGQSAYISGTLDKTNSKVSFIITDILSKKEGKFDCHINLTYGSSNIPFGGMTFVVLHGTIEDYVLNISSSDAFLTCLGTTAELKQAVLEFPEEYAETVVNNYVEEHSGGFVTQVRHDDDMQNLQTQLATQLGTVTGRVDDIESNVSQHETDIENLQTSTDNLNNEIFEDTITEIEWTHSGNTYPYGWETGEYDTEDGTIKNGNKYNFLSTVYAYNFPNRHTITINLPESESDDYKIKYTAWEKNTEGETPQAGDFLYESDYCDTLIFKASSSVMYRFTINGFDENDGHNGSKAKYNDESFISSIQGTIKRTSLKAKLDEVDEQQEISNKVIVTLQTTTNTLNSNITQNTSDIVTLQTTTNTLNSNITQNTSDIATLQTTTSNLTGGLHNAENDINNISTNIGFVGKSTNLFDSENPNIVRLTGNVSTQKFATVSGTSIWIRVKPNSTITLNKVGGDRLQAFTAESIPAKNGDYVQKKQLGNNTTTLTISVEDDIYVLFYLSTDPDYDVSETVIFYGEEWIDENTSDVQTMKPVVDKLLNLSDIPFSNLINLLSYRPLGRLSKGYICLTCDDGSENLVKTTIPILKRYKAEYNKKIPVTFGLMSSSHIFNPVGYPIVIDGVTVDGVTAVKEMLSTDYGCEVAIHGDTSYLSYTTTELINFLNEQKEYLTDTLDKEPNAIIYPLHDYDIRTSTICGSFYGVCATGGTYSPIKYSDCAGERSNLYTLYRLSLFNDNYMTKNRLKQKIDNCIENHMILLLFWHDNTLRNNYTLPLDPDNTTYQELLDYCVSYAIQNNVEFCTLGNIPYLK